MRLQGKACLITGAGSGIGKATARLYAREGARVVVADIQKPRADETARAIQDAGGHAVGLHVDVSESASVQRMIADALAAHGRIDVLVNNAGYGIAKTIEETDEAEWDRLMAVNVKGVFLGCKYAIPVMRRQGGGVIVNTASVASAVGLQRRVAYVTSKSAVAGLTRALALDHVADRIRVNCVAPGTIETPYFDEIFAQSPDPVALRREFEQRQPMNRLGTPDEIAAAMLFLASDESSYVTGSMLVVDGGWLAR